jgi:hypothetical protein
MEHRKGLPKMKKRMTTGEFGSYLERSKLRKITYYSENQDWADGVKVCRFGLHFETIITCEHPNIVCLRTGPSTISFYNVQAVEVDTDSSLLGEIFTIYCKNPRKVPSILRYKLIAV